MAAGTDTPKDGYLDVFAWLEKSPPTWTAWTVGLLVGLGSVIYGARGLYAYWRGEPPGKMTPSAVMGVGYIAFGAWIVVVLAQRFPS
jgi:hypothetical protein